MTDERMTVLPAIGASVIPEDVRAEIYSAERADPPLAVTNRTQPIADDVLAEHDRDARQALLELERERAEGQAPAESEP